MRLSSINETIEKIASRRLAEEWDNVGLLLGNPQAEIDCIACSLEADPTTIQAAKKRGAQLLIAHHPFIFRPIKCIDFSSPTGAIIEQAMKAGIAIYAAHTNFDWAVGGMNDVLAEKIGLENPKPIEFSPGEKSYKIVTFVPESHVKAVSGALFKAGAGVIGDYTGCSFQSKGVGTFIPGEKAAPFTGKKGQAAAEPEIRIEATASAKVLGAAISKMLAVHPYDEPAYDIYPLKEKKGQAGQGRIAKLQKPVTLDTLAGRVKQGLKLKNLRVVGKKSNKIRKVAVCTGSGASFIPTLRDPKSTCLVTGDVKYHEARLAMDLGLNVIDAGHFGTEMIFPDAMKRQLDMHLKGAAVRVIALKIEKDPFRVI